MSLLLAGCAAVLAAVGTYLVLQRKLSRIVVGIAMLSHAASVLWVTAGRRGDPPIIEGDVTGLSDPLPQAFALTAIVITFGITAFVLALAYRSWELTDDDEVEHDVADIEIRRGRSRTGPMSSDEGGPGR